MPRVSATEGAAKWARRTKAAVSDMTAGVDRVTESPMAAAVEKLDKMLSRFEEAIRSGKVERGLARTSLADWKNAMKNVGAGRVASGVDGKGTSKMESFAREFYAHLERVEEEVAAMPDLTIEDAVNRAAHVIRRNHGFKRGG